MSIVIPDNNELQILPASEERRRQLLRLARKSRHQWIMSGAKNEWQEMNNKNLNEKTDPTKLRKIPAVETLQEVLNFLSELSNQEHILIETLQFHDVDDDDIDDTQIPNHNSNMSPFVVFIEKLKLQQSAEIVKLMKQFVMTIENDIQERGAIAQSEEQINIRINKIWEFLKNIQIKMKENSLWINENQAEWDKTKEACEKFMFNQLHHLLFACDIDDVTKDKKTHDRIQSLEFLNSEHLDLNKNRNNSVDVELRKCSIILKDLIKCHNPHDKLHCIRKCTQSIIEALSSTRKSKSLPGADELLPGWILTLKEANPEQLNSTVIYLQRYTHPSKYVSEAGYILTNFVSAVHFLETVDATNLTISPTEFETSITRCRAEGMKQTEMAQMAAHEHTQKDFGEAAVVDESDTKALNESMSAKKKKTKKTPSEEIKGHQKSNASIHDIYKRLSQHQPLEGKGNESMLVKSFMSSSDGVRDRCDIDDKVDNENMKKISTKSRNRLRRSIINYDKDKRCQEITRSWSIVDKNEIDAINLPSFYNASADSVSVGDIPRLLAEYRLLAQACASYIVQTSHDDDTYLTKGSYNNSQF